MRKFIKTAAVYDKDPEWQAYFENLYDKVIYDVPLNEEETANLANAPDSLLEKVDTRKMQEQGLPVDTGKTTRVEKVKTKTPLEKSQFSEEEKKQLDELVEQEDESPEYEVLNSFFPDIFDENVFFRKVNEQGEYELLESKHMDASLNTLTYLRDIGFQTAIWHIGPEHSGKLNSIKTKKQLHNFCKPSAVSGGQPVCDFLNNQSISLDDLIETAKSKDYYPPKPIIAQSHPGCLCYLMCQPPVSPEDIPDNAQGLPTFGDDEELLFYKQELFNRIGQSPIPVDRFTVLSKEIYKAINAKKVNGLVVDEWDIRQAIKTQKGVRRYKKRLNYEAYDQDMWIKTASNEWEESIKPVIISDGYVFKSVIGSIRPIPNTYIGFQTNIQDRYGLVFLSNMARSTIAPIESIKEIKLKSNPSLKPDAMTFVKVGDSLGIIIKIFNDKKILCYIPDFGTLTFVDNVSPLEII